VTLLPHMAPATYSIRWHRRLTHPPVGGDRNQLGHVDPLALGASAPAAECHATGVPSDLFTLRLSAHRTAPAEISVRGGRRAPSRGRCDREGPPWSSGSAP
jgi:hypothetical protein